MDYICVDADIQNSKSEQIILQILFESPFCIVFIVENLIAEWIL